MARVDGDDPTELPDRLVELRLLLVDDTQLKVQILVGVFQGEAFPQGLTGTLVFLGAEVRGAQVEEQIRPLGIEVDGLAQ